MVNFPYEDLFQILEEYYKVDSEKSCTVKRVVRGDKYLFVNINFQDLEDTILGGKFVSLCS